MSENKIKKIENLDKAECLQILDLSYNKISVLEGVNECKKLEELWINSNEIENFSDLDILSNNPSLKVLYIWGNPVAQFPSVKQKLTTILPNLEQIDSTYLKVEYRFH